MNQYSIEKYDPGWGMKFQNIREMLRGIFGNKALGIEHVGSTSVPGMKAKPIIDVLVAVGDMTALEKERMTMIGRGYQFQENYVSQNTWLFRQTDSQGNGLENVHVCESGSSMEKQFLVMRDYLRAFPKEVTKYADLKDELVRAFPHDYASYRVAKDPFLKELEQRAYDWAQHRLRG